MTDPVGKLIVVAAPSGAGKTSLVRALIASEPGIEVAVSHTTRPRRPDDRDGIDYFFVSPTDFETARQANAFIECATVFGNQYGTSRREMERIREKGNTLILEIDWQGAAQIRCSVEDARSVFILPPSLETLRKRLLNRAQDDPDTVERRMSAAINEMSHYEEFDYLIVNDDFDTALTQLTRIYHGSGHEFVLSQQKTRFVALLNELLNH